jgi:ubiquinone/menaquinone biosynthesis C-methylase UbiE
MNGVNSVTLPAAATAFDRVADSYDELFTRSVIGRAQRKQVWSRLDAAFQPGQRILELNCGTGKDARHLAERGVSVVGCDASSSMIEVAKGTHPPASAAGNLEWLHLAIEDLHFLSKQRPFDGAFSNFSGVNCLTDLRPVAENLAGLVKPGGRVLLCLWSHVCVSEVAWYLLRGEARKAFRRFSGQATARIGEITFAVFYPTHGAVRRAFRPWFQLTSRRAVGLFVPPSYTEPWMRERESLLTRLEWLDRSCADWPILRNIGDHMLLEFVRCHR